MGKVASIVLCLFFCLFCSLVPANAFCDHFILFFSPFQLSNHQFEELAMDVYDEVDRRETDAGRLKLFVSVQLLLSCDQTDPFFFLVHWRICILLHSVAIWSSGVCIVSKLSSLARGLICVYCAQYYRWNKIVWTMAIRRLFRDERMW